jgi:hypothetical protein
MRDEIDYLLTQMDRTIREGQDIQGLDPARLADRWEAMVALLHVAGGYYYFGRGGQAEPVLRVAREILFKTGLANIRAKTEIARTYAITAGQGPVDVAKQRLEEIFTRLEGVKNGWTTERYYNRSQLEVIEAVVMAVVGDDFTLGASARRWLDDDEFLVRRRIHRDLRATMAQTS